MANRFSAGDLDLIVRASASDTLQYLDAIIQRLDFIESGLGSMSRGSRSIRGARTSGVGSKLLNFAKIGMSVYMMKRLGKELANIVQAGSDYAETLNLWQVAMRENLDQADEFIKKMNKAYGVSTKTLMNAQAIFKNMIGSLGQISDATSYALSEALVQMSIDFSSLYNVKLEKAFEKMQSMLAGQVRPIRYAGLDMTETTLFMFYQQLGGTKTMRQLNRTEKQLLSILAVFKQMGRAGALGDMAKTINSYANQTRMMVEYVNELKAWTGLILKDWIEQAGIITYINAGLITLTEIVKSFARSKGLGEENYIDGLFETTEATNDAVDELQGKLLEFDKFRSLSGEENFLNIDEKLLEAISGYSSIISDADSKAQKLAKTWLENLGFIYDSEKGIWKLGKNTSDIVKIAQKILNILKQVVKFGTIIWEMAQELAPLLLPILDIIESIVTFIVDAVQAVWDFAKGSDTLMSKTDRIANALQIIAQRLDEMLVDKLNKIDNILDKLDKIRDAIQPFLDAVERINTALDRTPSKLDNISQSLNTITGKFAGIKKIVEFFKNLDWDNIFGGKGSRGWRAFSVNLAYKNSQIAQDAVVPRYASGASNIDSGTLFVAGEMGKTEAVYTGSNGKTNVANIQQMKAAYRQALSEWWSTARNDIPAFEGVSESGVYTMVDREAGRRGKTFSKA